MNEDSNFIDASVIGEKNKSYLIQFWNNGYKWNYIVKSPSVERAFFKIKEINNLCEWNKIDDIKLIEELG